MNYLDFIDEFDNKINKYFHFYKEYICCKPGCCSCCEKGDYPLSLAEFEYLMKGFILLDNEQKKIVCSNIKSMVKGEKCPFLINKTCSVYKYRPIICRVHGLAYISKSNRVKLPYCAELGKNYSSVYNNGIFNMEPIKENLDTESILQNYKYSEIRNMYDWLHQA